MARRNRGSFSSGGVATARVHRDPPAAQYVPDPATLAMLRATWAERHRLDAWGRKFILDMLNQIRRHRLSDKQIDKAAQVAARVQVGFDDPRLDVSTGTPPPPRPKPPTLLPPNVLRVERWGALPAKPPGRR